MKELTAKDEIEAAVWADKFMSEALRNSAMAAIGAEQREAMRLSLVEVDGEPVNQNGVPFLAMDSWSLKTIRLAQTAFNDLNGVDAEDLKNFKASARVSPPGESLATQSPKKLKGVSGGNG
jgi:hypothetical protein